MLTPGTFCVWIFVVRNFQSKRYYYDIQKDKLHYRYIDGENELSSNTSEL